jgi:uncharacterized membrane protein YphA (DoxX/SURF4 family)
VNDPLLLVPAVAYVTRDLGFGVTRSIGVDAPIKGGRHLVTYLPLIAWTPPMPDIAVWISILVHLLGGWALLVGFYARWAAALLALVCLGTAFGVNLPAGDQGNMIHFYKNLVMTGGFLYVIAASESQRWPSASGKCLSGNRAPNWSLSRCCERRTVPLLTQPSIIVSRSHRTMTAYVGLFLYIGHFLDTTPGSTT